MQNKATLLLLIVSASVLFGCKQTSKQKDEAYARNTTATMAVALREVKSKGYSLDNADDLQKVFSPQKLKDYVYTGGKEQGVLLFRKEAVELDGKLTHYGISADFKVLIIQYEK